MIEHYILESDRQAQLVLEADKMAEARWEGKNVFVNNNRWYMLMTRKVKK